MDPLWMDPSTHRGHSRPSSVGTVNVLDATHGSLSESLWVTQKKDRPHRPHPTHSHVLVN